MHPLPLSNLLLATLALLAQAPAPRTPAPQTATNAASTPTLVATTPLSLGSDPRVRIGPATTPGDDATVYRISAPGSYYLPANLTGEPSKSGIEIAASNVTVDLMGFELGGVPGSLSGLRVTGPRTMITVVNGSVRSWGAHGLDLDEAESVVLEDVHALANGGHGFLLHVGATVSGCSARSNLASGFRVGPGARLRDSTALYNGNYGFDVQGFGSVSGCLAGGSSYSGFHFARGVAADNCTSRLNEDMGYIANEGSTLVGCAATDNGTGFDLDRSTARGCTAVDNGSNGFELGGGCALLESLSEQNGFNGVYVSGNDNRVEANHVSKHAGGKGFHVNGSENLVVRNTSLNNAVAFSVAAGNGFGPLLSLGNGTITSSNPWANWQE